MPGHYRARSGKTPYLLLVVGSELAACSRRGCNCARRMRTNSLLEGAAAGGLPTNPPSIQAVTARTSALGSVSFKCSAVTMEPTQLYIARMRGRILGPP